MKRLRLGWQIQLGLILILLSAMVYLLHYLLFRDIHHIFIYLIGDIAFVFIEVLLVTMIIHRLLNEREKRARLKKLNMVIGAFFSEVGTWLLAELSRSDPDLDRIREQFLVGGDWSEKNFSTASKTLEHSDYTIDIQKVDLANLRNYLIGKRDFLLRLLENPNLLEHEAFTGLLRAVFHLAEELTYRTKLVGLPATDYEHLAGDIKRVYSRLAYEWVAYLKHLKDNFPYLFSLSLRTNPFDRTASPIVR